MGKTTNTTYPSSASGAISINGNQKSSSFTSNGVTSGNYNMSNAEKALYEYSQNQLAQQVPQINSFLPETWNSINQQLSAYTSQGAKTINNVYEPLLKSLKSDIASRFGNFDNSSFLNKLNNIEDKRSDAMSALAQNVQAERSSLVNDELTRRYSYLNLLNGLQNQTLSNALAFINGSNTSNSLGNSYLQSLYNLSSKNSSNNMSTLSALASILGNTGIL